MERIRATAFAPVFASVRKILGDELYELAQRHEDEAQSDLLRSLVEPDSEWELVVAEDDGAAVGFVSWKLDQKSKVGEIGLNAVAPERAGCGIGTAMYEFAVERMREGGMRAAGVATGADPSHEPARRAYEKAGFRTSFPSVWLCRKL